MVRCRKTLPGWEPYDWSGDDGEQIAARLDEAREEICRLLDIDPDAKQPRGFSEREYTHNDRDADEDRLRYRNSSAGGEFVYDIDLVLEDLHAACLRCCGDLVNEEALASIRYAAPYRIRPTG